MIKKITLLAILALGSLGTMAQSVTHAGELKKEALDFSGDVMAGVKTGDKAFTVEEKSVGNDKVKVTKKNGKVVKIAKQRIDGDMMHVTVYFYKNEKLIFSVYKAGLKTEKKKIGNFRYFDKKGVCQSSVLQDGINGDNSVKEITDQTKDVKTRLNESKQLMKLAKKGSLEGIAKLELLQF